MRKPISDTVKRHGRIGRLKELRDYANFTRASFGPLTSAPITLKGSEQVTEYIKEQTRHYRDSWVNPIIDELIAEEEAKAERRKAKK